MITNYERLFVFCFTDIECQQIKDLVGPLNNTVILWGRSKCCKQGGRCDDRSDSLDNCRSVV